MSKDQDRYAIFAAASYEPAKRDSMIRKYPETRGWKIDNALSNNRNTVFYNPQTREAVLSVKGTDLDQVDDLTNDALIIMGEERQGVRYRETRQILENMRQQYPQVSVTGHSLGGRIAIDLAEDFDIPAHVFNPGTTYKGIGKKALETLWQAATRGKAKNIQSYNTSTDLISIFSVFDPKLKRKFVPTKKGLNAHSINNFLPDEQPEDISQDEPSAKRVNVDSTLAPGGVATIDPTNPPPPTDNPFTIDPPVSVLPPLPPPPPPPPPPPKTEGPSDRSIGDDVGTTDPTDYGEEYNPGAHSKGGKIEHGHDTVVFKGPPPAAYEWHDPLSGWYYVWNQATELWDLFWNSDFVQGVIDTGATAARTVEQSETYQGIKDTVETAERTVEQDETYQAIKETVVDVVDAIKEVLVDDIHKFLSNPDVDPTQKAIVGGLYEFDQDLFFLLFTPGGKAKAAEKIEKYAGYGYKLWLRFKNFLARRFGASLDYLGINAPELKEFLLMFERGAAAEEGLAAREGAIAFRPNPNPIRAPVSEGGAYKELIGGPGELPSHSSSYVRQAAKAEYAHLQPAGIIGKTTKRIGDSASRLFQRSYASREREAERNLYRGIEEERKVYYALREEEAAVRSGPISGPVDRAILKEKKLMTKEDQELTNIMSTYIRPVPSQVSRSIVPTASAQAPRGIIPTPVNTDPIFGFLDDIIRRA